MSHRYRREAHLRACRPPSGEVRCRACRSRPETPAIDQAYKARPDRQAANRPGPPGSRLRPLARSALRSQENSLSWLPRGTPSTSPSYQAHVDCSPHIALRNPTRASCSRRDALAQRHAVEESRNYCLTIWLPLPEPRRKSSACALIAGQKSRHGARDVGPPTVQASKRSRTPREPSIAGLRPTRFRAGLQAHVPRGNQITRSRPQRRLSWDGASPRSRRRCGRCRSERRAVESSARIVRPPVQWPNCMSARPHVAELASNQGARSRTRRNCDQRPAPEVAFEVTQEIAKTGSVVRPAVILEWVGVNRAAWGGI